MKPKPKVIHHGTQYFLEKRITCPECGDIPLSSQIQFEETGYTPPFGDYKIKCSNCDCTYAFGWGPGDDE